MSTTSIAHTILDPNTTYTFTKETIIPFATKVKAACDRSGDASLQRARETFLTPTLQSAYIALKRGYTKEVTLDPRTISIFHACVNGAGSLKPKRVIGAGAHGTVATIRLGSIELVEKAVKSKEQLKTHMHEQRMLWKLRSEWVVPLLGVSNRRAIILPLCTRLAAHIHKRLSASDITTIALGALEALAFLEKKGVIHRDIKPDNLALFERRVVILDLGFAVSCTQAPTKTGTLGYMAPELIALEKSSSLSPLTKVDVWSLGITLAQIVIGSPGISPFYPLSKKHITQEEVALHLTTIFTQFAATVDKADPKKTLQNLIRAMLIVDPNRRSTAKELLRKLLKEILNKSFAPSPVAAIRKS